VASTAGGAPEAVVDDQTGSLVPPNDVAAVVNALDRIVGDQDLRLCMSIAARRKVEDYFAMDKYIQRVLATYERAIARSRDKLHRMATEDQERTESAQAQMA